MLSTNPDLLLEEWSAVFVPGQLLQTLGGLFTDEDGVELPEGSGLSASRTASTLKQASTRSRGQYCRGALC